MKLADDRVFICQGKCSNIKNFVQDQELNFFFFFSTAGKVMKLMLNGKKVNLKGKHCGNITTVSNHLMKQFFFLASKIE